MPSVHLLHLLLAALLPVCSLGDPIPLHKELESGDTSGDELQEVVDHHKWQSIARLLQRNIARLRDEQFKRDFGEMGMNMTDFDNVRIQTPFLNQSDGCLSKNFREQKCLRSMYSILKMYKSYLLYVEKENLSAELMDGINLWTARLLHILKEKVGDAQVSHQPISELPDDSAWTRKTVTHSILHNFSLFMVNSVRAIDYMNRKGMRHTVRETKEAEWLSAKQEQ